jgi:hypothetical protein
VTSNNQQFPGIPAPGVSQQDLDDAGIPGSVVLSGGTQFLILDSTASEANHEAAQALAGQIPVSAAVPTQEQIGLTDTWLTLKACLDALPAATDPDPHADARTRLTASVAAALQVATDAGGTG